jgi:hypothetical protein
MKKPKRYRPTFNRDWWFYNENSERFTFCGSAVELPAFAKEGVDAKTAFWQLDSLGRCDPTRHPLHLQRILRTKASLNFQIRQWCEGRIEGCLPMCEFKPYLQKIQAPMWVLEAVIQQSACLYFDPHRFDKNL